MSYKINYFQVRALGKAYLSEVAAKILDLISQNQDLDFWILTPNYFSIEVLKDQLFSTNKIIRGNNSLILPRITTAENYILEQMLQTEPDEYSHYEQVIIMSQIIMQYNNQMYKVSEAIDIASEFVLIYWNMKKNIIEHEQIDKWVEQDLAEHWWHTADFLKFCFQKFEYFVDTNHLLSVSGEIKLFNKRYIILVGLMENLNFFIEYFQKQDTYHLVILPPEIDRDLCLENAYSSYMLRYYPEEQCESVPRNHINTHYSKLYEFSDIYDEAHFISNYSSQLASTGTKVIIITNNSFLEKLIAVGLAARSTRFCSSFGDKYSTMKEASMLQSIARIKYENGSMESFLALISSGLIYQNEGIKILIQSLNQEKKIYENFESVFNEHYLLIQSLGLEEFFIIMQNHINSNIEYLDTLLMNTYRIFKEIYKSLGLKSKYSNAERFRNFMEDIASMPGQHFKIGSEEFCIYTECIFSLKKVMPFDKTAQILILKYDDSLLLDANEVIFANFNHESVINNSDDHWLSRRIFGKILGDSPSENFHKILYHVSSKLFGYRRCGKVTFTRSKFTDSIISEKCAILDYIPHRTTYIEPHLLKKDEGDNKLINIEDNKNAMNVHKSDLPTKLYATNIELLLRNPYGFFAKKILGISQKRNLFSIIEPSYFGSIIHKHIEQICLYKRDPALSFEKICIQMGVPYFYCNIWKDAALKIAQEVIHLNNSVEQNNGEFFVEIEGNCIIKLEQSLELDAQNTNSTSINLRAIADRIEVVNNSIRIIDFKTGAPPSKKDVLCGKSPQLMIEAMIYLRGGFKDIIVDLSKNIELVFYKVNTRSPYLEEKIIYVTPEEVLEHENGLVELLQFYYNNRDISFDDIAIPDYLRPKYDDYLHLSRTLEV